MSVQSPSDSSPSELPPLSDLMVQAEHPVWISRFAETFHKQALPFPTFERRPFQAEHGNFLSSAQGRYLKPPPLRNILKPDPQIFPKSQIKWLKESWLTQPPPMPKGGQSLSFLEPLLVLLLYRTEGLGQTSPPLPLLPL